MTYSNSFAYITPGLKFKEPICPAKNHSEMVELIKNVVCEYYGVEFCQLTTKSRKRTFLVPRQTIIYFLRRYTNLSLGAISGMFGGRDHTTAIHSLNTVSNISDTDPTYRGQLNQIEYLIS